MPVGGGQYKGESILFIAEDGHKYRLTTVSGTRAVLSDEGSGMPPLEYITERAPYQDGESVKDFFLRPRIVQYLYRQRFCSREDYWNGRNSLINALRPNRGVAGVIRTIRPGNIRRDLVCTILEGPKFEPRKQGEWDEWAIQEILRFIAYDPVYFDPTEHTSQFGPCGLGPGFPYTFPFAFDIDCQLVYPITYPITYEQFDFTQIITNAGTWKSFPTITIVGPAYTVNIENETTGQSIAIQGYMLAPGSSIIIDLTDGVKTVELDDGTNLIQYMVGDLSTFTLEPGENTVRVTMGSHGGATNVQIDWYDKFLGI